MRPRSRAPNRRPEPHGVLTHGRQQGLCRLEHQAGLRRGLRRDHRQGSPSNGGWRWERNANNNNDNSNRAQTGSTLLSLSLVAPDDRVAAVQTLSGTGACRLMAEYIAHHMPERTTFIPAETWANHYNIWGVGHICCVGRFRVRLAF